MSLTVSTLLEAASVADCAGVEGDGRVDAQHGRGSKTEDTVNQAVGPEMSAGSKQLGSRPSYWDAGVEDTLQNTGPSSVPGA